MSDYEVSLPPINIDDLPLSVRAYNCLRREGVVTVAELVAKTEDQLLNMRNLGQREIDKIKDILHAHDLHLAQEWERFGEAGEVIHEQVNIWRRDGVTVTVQPNDDVDLNMAHFSADQFDSLCAIIEEIKEGDTK